MANFPVRKLLVWRVDSSLETIKSPKHQFLEYSLSIRKIVCFPPETIVISDVCTLPSGND